MQPTSETPKKSLELAEMIETGKMYEQAEFNNRVEINYRGD